MMITGLQIREARRLLGWTLNQLSMQTNIPWSTLERAESVDDTPGIMLAQGVSIKQAFEKAGVRFGSGLLWLEPSG